MNLELIKERRLLRNRSAAWPQTNERITGRTTSFAHYQGLCSIKEKELIVLTQRPTIPLTLHSLGTAPALDRYATCALVRADDGNPVRRE